MGADVQVLAVAEAARFRAVLERIAKLPHVRAEPGDPCPVCVAEAALSAGPR